jgi:hypothetical protein
MILSKFSDSPKAYAQLAGSLYLLIAVIGGFSIGYMPMQIVADGDATLTFQQLMAQQTLFQLGLTGDIMVLVCELLLTVMLFHLFQSVSKTGIQLATYARLAMAIIMGMNLINYLIPAVIITQPAYLNAFSATQLEALTLLFFKAHKYGEWIWQVSFAVHLFTLGYVIRKSTLTPKGLGVLMLLGGIGYGGDSLMPLILIQSEVLTVVFSTLLVLAVIAEFWFAFWLIFSTAAHRLKNAPSDMRAGVSPSM